MATSEIKMYSDYKSPFAYLAFEPGIPAGEALQRKGPLDTLSTTRKRTKASGASTRSTRLGTQLDARRWAKSRGLLIRSQPKVYDTRIALIGGLFAQQHARLLPFNLKVYELFWKCESHNPTISLLRLLRVWVSQRTISCGPRGTRSGLLNKRNKKPLLTIFGVPIFVFANEPFWGYDRLPVLEERLAEAGLKL